MKLGMLFNDIDGILYGSKSVPMYVSNVQCPNLLEVSGIKGVAEIHVGLEGKIF